MPHEPASPTANLEPTYRWQRRAVQRVRFTWLGMVLVLCLMAHRSVLQSFPDWSMTLKVLSGVGMVVIPMCLLMLWRLGLLPPERVLVASEDAGDPRLKDAQPHGH